MVRPRLVSSGLLVLQDYDDWSEFWIPMIVARTGATYLPQRSGLPFVFRVDALRLDDLPRRFEDLTPADARKILDAPGSAHLRRVQLAVLTAALGDREEAQDLLEATAQTWPAGRPVSPLVEASTWLGRPLGKRERQLIAGQRLRRRLELGPRFARAVVGANRPTL
jgi:hypothetical protein